jgi:hypothetical protein
MAKSRMICSSKETDWFSGNKEYNQELFNFSLLISILSISSLLKKEEKIE